MADMANAFPSKYLKASDLQDREHNVVMDRVEFEIIGDDERKPVLYFQNRQKGLVLNKTNNKTIIAEHGRNSDNWQGKRIILFPTLADFRGDQVEAIRVKMPKIKGAPTPAAQTVAQAQAQTAASVAPGDPAAAGEMDDEIPF